MNISGLLCPIDNLSLASTPTRLLGNQDPTRIAVGEHVHVAVDAELVCANGHRWSFKTDLTMQRER